MIGENEIKWDSLSNSQKRRLRLSHARSLGMHTKSEWMEMLEFFNYTCCLCGCDYRIRPIQKDHIIPIYQGGSDAINNIQPLCSRCNASKGPDCTDLRPILASIQGNLLPKKYTLNG